MRFGPFFVVTIAFGALVGWFAPTTADTAGADRPATQPEARVAVARREGWHTGEAVLQRQGDGHFYAEVSTGSGSVMMLVDTGATVVVLTGNDAAMMGVDWDESAVRPVARSASGVVYGVPVMLDSLQVDDLEARHVEAVVVPRDLDISLLGQSFLSKMKRVEMNGDEMVLAD